MPETENKPVDIYLFRYPKDMNVMYDQMGVPVGFLDESKGGKDVSGMDEILIFGDEPMPVSKLTGALHDRFGGTMEQKTAEIDDSKVHYGEIITNKTAPKNIYKIGPFTLKGVKGLGTYPMRFLLKLAAFRNLGWGDIDYKIHIRHLPESSKKLSVRKAKLESDL